MHGSISRAAAAAIEATLASESETSLTLGGESNPHEWFYRAACALLGKDAGYALHKLTGYPESSCYAYVAENPAKRRRPPEHLIRRICHIHEGFYLAFMQDCEAPWWQTRERDRADAAIFRNAIEQVSHERRSG